MALGALIGAYQEDDSGGLTALLPLAGRTLVEYQARCAAAAGASPIVVLVERIPAALNQAFERLRHEGVNLVLVSEGEEAVSRFEPGQLILLIGDGIVPPLELLTGLSDEQEALVLTVPDDEQHEQFERVDSVSRWSGVAVADARTLGATVAMLGDWDLPSTLLRRSLQAGARLVPVAPELEPRLALGEGELQRFERNLLSSARADRNDSVSRYLLPWLEDFGTERLMETHVRPDWLLHGALALTAGATFCFTRGWHWAALVMLLLSTPLDLVGERLGKLRLRPIAPGSYARRLLWPFAALPVLTLGWWEWEHEGGWGAMLAALVLIVLAQADRFEREHAPGPMPHWLFSRRNAIFAAIPFAVAGAWTGLLVGLLVYAGISFFLAQHLVHRLPDQLTPH